LCSFLVFRAPLKMLGVDCQIHTLSGGLGNPP
jgi:hypothetical protein